jgi:hypothetical protein
MSAIAKENNVYLIVPIFEIDNRACCTSGFLSPSTNKKFSEIKGRFSKNRLVQQAHIS